MNLISIGRGVRAGGDDDIDPVAVVTLVSRHLDVAPGILDDGRYAGPAQAVLPRTGPAGVSAAERFDPSARRRPAAGDGLGWNLVDERVRSKAGIGLAAVDRLAFQIHRQREHVGLEPEFTPVEPRGEGEGQDYG